MRKRVARVVLLGAVFPGVVQAVEPNSTSDPLRRKGKEKTTVVDPTERLNNKVDMQSLTKKASAEPDQVDDSGLLTTSTTLTKEKGIEPVKSPVEAERSVQLKGVRG